MGLLTELFRAGGDRRTLESPLVPLSSPNILSFVGGQRPTEAGVDYSASAATRLGAVWACLRVRAEALAALPWDVYERLPAGGRRVVDSHPLTEFLRDMTFREAYSWHVDGWGNGYAEVDRSASGAVRGLRILPPTSTYAARSATGALAYVNVPEDSGELRVLPARNVVHAAGPGWDGISGFSVLAHHADTIGYALGARRAGSRLLANDARPVGLLKVPGRLEEGAAEAIRERFEFYQRRENYGRLAVVGAGAEYENIGLPPNQLQFVEQMEWGLLDVARVFLVPPHKIGYLKDAGDRANIEHENLRFATDVLVPAARRLELAFDRKLLSVAEQDRGLFTKIDLRGMLRGDYKTRMEGHAISRTNGLKNANEIRALEDEAPIEGRAGEAYLVPLNLVDAALEPAEPAPAPEADPAPDPAAERAARLEALAPLFCDLAGRVARREREELVAVARLVEREGMSRRVDERLAVLWRAGSERLERGLAPILEAAGLAPDPGYFAGRAVDYERRRRLLVAELVEHSGREPGGQARGILEGWPEGLAAELAQAEQAAAAELGPEDE